MLEFNIKSLSRTTIIESLQKLKINSKKETIVFNSPNNDDIHIQKTCVGTFLLDRYLKNKKGIFCDE